MRANLLLLNLVQSTAKTAQGLENYRLSWSRIENGLWDSAFAYNGNQPVALDFGNTAFGAVDYVGNHVLNAAPGQASDPCALRTLSGLH